MRSEYRTKALENAVWYPKEIKSGDFDDQIPEEAMVFGDTVADVINSIEVDVNDILRDLENVKGIDLIDDVRDKLKILADKLY